MGDVVGAAGTASVCGEEVVLASGAPEHATSAAAEMIARAPPTNPRRWPRPSQRRLDILTEFLSNELLWARPTTRSR